MTNWALVLVPFLVLPIVLLFRFIGCGIDAVGTAVPPTGSTPPPTGSTPPPTGSKPPGYRNYIMGEPNNPGTVKHSGVIPNKMDVVGYWRLIEPAGAPIAKDEKGFQDGQYVEGQAIPLEAPTAATPGSEAAAGNFVAGQNGLILSEPSALCRYFNGGYVRVPFKAGLYTDEFTVEAWVEPHPLKKDYEYTLFDAGGRYPIGSAATAPHGFRIYENRNGCWQMRGAGTGELFLNPPLVPRPGKTHLALTYGKDPDGVKRLRIYLDGKEAASVGWNSYSKPDGAPLFIGVANTTPVPTDPVQLRTPALMRIQEVVLHKKALSKEEIENHVDINRV